MKRPKQLSISAALFPAMLAAMVSVLAVSAYAANPSTPVKISDIPSRVLFDPTKLVPTNMLLLVDDSGSMTWTHAPEGLGDIKRACWRGADGVIGGVFLCSPSDPQCLTMDVCGYPYPNPYPGSGSGYPSLGTGVTPEEIAVKLVPPPLMAAGFNKMVYHPEVDYLPPVYEDQAEYVDIDGNKKPVIHSFPSMGSSYWSSVGWPTSVATSSGAINRPQGVPVTINMKDVTTKFPQARTYYPDQRFSLQLRYMSGSSQLALLADVMPMHYFKTSVKWCKYYQSQSPTPDGNPITPSQYYEGTLYLGSASPQDCQDNRTPTYQYPYYYFPNGKYTTPNKEDHTKYPSFEVVVLDYAKGEVNGSATALVTYTYVDKNGVLQTGSRTPAKELENYANWYAYYSNRAAATRTVASHALAGIDPDRWLRMGVVSVSDCGKNNCSGLAGLIDLRKETGTRKTNKFNIYKALLESVVPATNEGTPLKTAIDGVRQKFDDKSSSLICNSCQRNYLVTLSDGGWNDSATVLPADQDNTVTISAPVLNTLAPNTYQLGVGLSAGATWPRPILEDVVKSDTLSDISLYAWLKELKGGPKNQDTVNKEYYEADRAVYDPAGWKHLNTQALAYAGGGRLPTARTDFAPGAVASAYNGLSNAALRQTLFDITNNVRRWPASQPVRFVTTPPPHYTSIDYSFLWPTAADDLWHATVSSGFNRFSPGLDPQQDFSRAIDADLENIFNRGMSFSELGLPPSKDFQNTIDNNCSKGSQMCGYSASFAPGWGGDLVKRTILDVNPSGEVIWSAEDAMASKLGKSSGKSSIKPQDATWVDSRKIFTATSGGGGIAFTRSGMASGYGSALSTILETSNTTEQDNVVNYLRGDWKNEESPGGGKYRRREHFLGDFVHSSAVVVTAPDFQYTNADNPGYSNFKNDNKNRARVIYAAGNDGMLHAFEDSKGNGGKGGDELWAFIPPDLFRPADEGGIINLTHSVDNSWTHRYYVDATPRVIDVDLKGDGSGWATMLIGGMGKGGTSYYALDVTNGDDPGASGAQGEKMFKWTFTDDNMGYTYGRALMVKTNAWNNKWVAILPSGINNGASGDSRAKPMKDASGSPVNGGDGKGRIFFVDLETGKKLWEIVADAGGAGGTSEGSKDQPSGLAYIRAFVTGGSSNQLADAVYGGDQLGNFWRFDLTSTDPKNWKVDKLAVLADSGGKFLPANTEPQVDVDPATGTRWVMVGTGRFYDDADLYDWTKTPPDYLDVVHGMFAFKDGDAKKPSTTAKLPYTSGGLDNITGVDTPSLSSSGGWVNFLPKGYQIINNFDALGGNVAFVANQYVWWSGQKVDDGHLCETLPFNGLLYEREIGTGVALVTPNFNNPDEGGLSSPSFIKRRDGSNVLLKVSPGIYYGHGRGRHNTKDKDQATGASGAPKRSSIRFINR
ncbi:MAG: PilC/PilY family type IV pilus protein [Proteobacteria bacterium]|nr:PilC/PilY family type IV pilus protein [Pseudomonadota bacterium]